MAVRNAQAVWNGNLQDGKGDIRLGGGLESPYGFSSRFEDGRGTNPEELIGGAHAGCFSMALAHQLGEAGYTPTEIRTNARVHLEKQGEGFAIPRIELDLEAEVPEVDEETFLRIAESAKSGCPVSKALAGTEIALNARLMQARKA